MPDYRKVEPQTPTKRNLEQIRRHAGGIAHRSTAQPPCRERAGLGQKESPIGGAKRGQEPVNERFFSELVSLGLPSVSRFVPFRSILGPRGPHPFDNATPIRNVMETVLFQSTLGPRSTRQRHRSRGVAVGKLTRQYCSYLLEFTVKNREGICPSGPIGRNISSSSTSEPQSPVPH